MNEAIRVVANREDVNVERGWRGDGILKGVLLGKRGSRRDPSGLGYT